MNYWTIEVFFFMSKYIRWAVGFVFLVFLRDIHPVVQVLLLLSGLISLQTFCMVTA